MSEYQSSSEPESSVAMNASRLGDHLERLTGPMWRLFAAGIAVALIAMLAVAWTLEPSASGLGTHQKLGLPPCSIRVLFGIRCPSCGMTTSWAHFMKGNLWQSLQSNIGGLLLAIYSLCTIPIAARYAWNGDPLKVRLLKWGVYALVSIAVISCAQWLWLLARGA